MNCNTTQMPRTQTSQKPAPKQHHHAKSNQIYPSPPVSTPIHPPPPTRSNIGGLLYGSFMQGIGLGAGSSIGHKIVDSMVGSATIVSKPDNSITREASSKSVVPIDNGSSSGDPCKQFYDDYQECIYSGQDCDILYERYVRCVTEAHHIK